MAALTPTPVQQFLDASGAPLVGGKLFTYLAGTNTKTPTYEDAAAGSTNTNPIRLDARGEARIWLNPALSYKFVLANSTDTDPPTSPIWTVDNISTGGTTDSGVFNVKLYGAIGDGIADDTAAIQAAIDAAKAAGSGVVYYPGPAHYLVTRSLDSTRLHPGFPIRHVGDGRFISFILHAFPPGEAYPVIDGCGNGYGGLWSLSIRPQGTSYATCAYLAAKNADGSAGNVQEISGCDLSAGRVLGDAVAVFSNTDLSRVLLTKLVGGGAGLWMGNQLPANVTSKFVTISANIDWTQGYVDICECVGDLDAGLVFSGGNLITVTSTYVAIAPTGCAAIVRLGTSGGAGNIGIIASGLRTENQSSTTGVAAIFFEISTSICDIVGALTTDTAGCVLGSAAGALVAHGRVSTQPTGPMNNWFAMAGPCQDMVFSGGPTHFGTMPTTSTYNLAFNAAPIATEVFAALGTIQGLSVEQAGSVFRSGAEILIAPGYTATQGRYEGRFVEGNVASAAYTGGSGEQNILALTVPAALAKDWFTGQIPPSSLSLQLFGRVNATNQAGGRLRVELVQGVNTADLLDWNAGPPAGNSPGGGLRIGIELFRSGSNTFRTQNEIRFCGSLFEGPFSDLGAFLTTAGDFTINVYVTNAGNTPITIFRERLTI